MYISPLSLQILLFIGNMTSRFKFFLEKKLYYMNYTNFKKSVPFFH